MAVSRTEHSSAITHFISRVTPFASQHSLSFLCKITTVLIKMQLGSHYSPQPFPSEKIVLPSRCCWLVLRVFLFTIWNANPSFAGSQTLLFRYYPQTQTLFPLMFMWEGRDQKIHLYFLLLLLGTYLCCTLTDFTDWLLSDILLFPNSFLHFNILLCCNTC